MSFSSLLEEANQTLDSEGDQNDTQWSIDSSNSTALPSPKTPLSLPIKQEIQLHQNGTNIKLKQQFTPNGIEKAEAQFHLNTNGIKLEANFTPKNMNMGFVPNTEYAGGTIYPGEMKQFPSFDVRTEPNPYYQNGMVNGMNHQQFYQQQMFQQRTHLPIQYDEYYNMNSLPKQDFIMNSNNNANGQPIYQGPQKPLTTNVLPQNIKTEKNRKRSNKKSEPRKKVGNTA